MVVNKEEPDFEKPTPIAEDATRADVEEYRMLLKMYHEDKRQYAKDKGMLFRVIMGQCLPPMKNKIEAWSDYKEAEKTDDVTSLLAYMRELAYSTSKTQYEYWTMQATMRKFMTMRQGPKESLEHFAKRFLAQVEVTEDVWGKMSPMKLKGKSLEEQNKAGEKYKACVFLAGVDRGRYKRAIDALNNDFLLDKVEYPEDVTAMMQYLSNRRGGGGTSKQVEAMRDGLGTSFVQKGRMKNVICYKCGKRGHIARDCEEEDEDGASTVSSKSVTAASGKRMMPGWAKK